MMFEVPLGMALVAIEIEFKDMPEGRCTVCAISESLCGKIACDALKRKDQKNVVYKLVQLEK